MISLFIITIQIILAFFIITTFYLLMVYYIKNKFGKKEDARKKVSKKEHHFAIIFNDYIQETDLFSQINILSNQPYKNYSAYFFIDQPYVGSNNLPFVKIIRPLQKRFGKFGLLNLAKNYFETQPDAVLILDSQSQINSNFLFEMNQYLCEGYRVIQSQVQVNSYPNSVKGFYQTFAKRFYNLIDRSLHQSSGISSALWNQGFVIESSLFESLDFDKYTNSDKALQAELIFRSEKIAFASEAYLLEPELNQQEFYLLKQKWYQQYFFNYRLGINLLIEGIKNPNTDKILFGFNFMRPPLIILMLSSMCLGVIDIIWMPKLVFFLWLSIFGAACSLLVLTKPSNPFALFKFIKLSVIALFGKSKFKQAKLNLQNNFEPLKNTTSIIL